tara:strand:+ start:400 stop:612 length:213 start_codon:yes stop_codon:yes gene_type:complete
MKSTIGKLDVLSVFAAWALLIVFFVSLAYGKTFSEPSASHLVYLFGAFFCAVLIHIVLAFLTVARIAISV